MVSLKNISHYTTQLATALKSGLPIDRALATLQRSATTRRLRRISKDVKQSINSGHSLTTAFEKYRDYFPPNFVSFINVGETTGHLEEVTSSLADFYQTRYLTIRRMKSSLFIIGFYFFICLCIIVFIEYVRAGWNFSVAGNRLKTIAIVVVGILIFIQLYRNVRFVRESTLHLLSHFPFVCGIIRKFCVSRFSESMYLGLATGMDVKKTILISAESMGNPYYEQKAKKALKYIDAGDTITTALKKTGIFPELVMGLFDVGEQSGQLAGIMANVADVTGEEAQLAAKILSRIVVITIYVVILFYVAYFIITFWLGYFSRAIGIM